MGKNFFNETKLLLFPNNIPFFSDVQPYLSQKFKINGNQLVKNFKEDFNVYLV